MIGQSKTNPDLQLLIIDVKEKTFTGKVIKPGGTWKKNEVGMNFDINEFHVIMEIKKVLEIRKQIESLQNSL